MQRQRSTKSTVAGGGDVRYGRPMEPVIANEPSPLFLKRAFDSTREVLELAARLKQFLQSLEEESAPNSTKRDEIKALSALRPDLFARRYMLKNMVKCSIAAEYFKTDLRNTRRIIDLGTGPGTFLVPFLAHLKGVEFIGIDHSRAALMFARTMFEFCNLPLPLLVHGSVPGAISSGGKFFTASYLLAEFAGTDLTSFCRWMVQRSDAKFLIVDYPDVIASVARYVAPLRPCKVKIFQLQLPVDIAGVVDDREISFGVIYAPSASIRPAETVDRELEESRHQQFNRVVR